MACIQRSCSRSHPCCLPFSWLLLPQKGKVPKVLEDEEEEEPEADEEIQVLIKLGWDVI